ncbi:VCBS repeat-containing protein [uncultured Kordia sp.]|uniref:VCBS repeat-containing protein n=1 Tax=uncultured Kordia sp. TaxID=507699 RepID=UPI002631DD76|nr:VCBS repeat-containing protein [uncultured Kordia sp.]
MKFFKQYKIVYVLLLLFCVGCTQKTSEKSDTLFGLINNEHTNIHFKNEVQENLYFNFLNYSYIYNGGGIAVGDINNDGLDDLYFSSNQGSNALYLNKGDFKFEDITKKSKVSDEHGWTTGVSMIDINNDGWLDIYVCKSGSLKNHNLRKNKLFINQKDNTFKENAAAYGIDHFGFSTQAYFFDYDTDGDLDLYLVNHRFDFQNNTNIDPRIQQRKEPFNSDQLFRNDGKRFTNVTSAAGIENKAWGLSASIGDFNNDNLPDIYVANDFLEPDFLYINQGDGTFKDEILERFKHISANSMGSDFADINNDLLPDLIVLDMLAEDHIRSKENMATMSTENFHSVVNAGYHHQYMSNMLQLNNGDGTYSEIGQLSGIAKTDWSWAPLIADFDNDGYNDVFVTNGIEHDLSNQDFRNKMKTNIQNRKKVSLEEAINMMPSNTLSNYIFQNNKDLSFSNRTKDWGFTTKVNSSGAVYVDLDNDGDLDLVTNNQDAEAQVYKNYSDGNSVTISLIGTSQNIHGIGTTVHVYANGLQQSKTLQLSRGFQSSITNKLHFGLGELTKVDSVEVFWQDGKRQLLSNLKIGETITIEYKNAIKEKVKNSNSIALFETISPNDLGIEYAQKENDFNDFDLQVLLPQKQSEKGNPLAVADVNNDGLDDFFVGNAKDASGKLFIQKNDGTFTEKSQKTFETDKKYEDTNAQFIDVDNDNDVDLYITSGGYENAENSPLLQDRLYINDGKGNYTKSDRLPKIHSNTKAIAYGDYDNDGDLDIFIGGSTKHGKYPLAETSYLLKNENGKFINTNDTVISEIYELRIVNDAVFSDYDADGDMDLLVVGEWMPIIIFENKKGKFSKKNLSEIEHSSGWYQSITATDIDNDGDQDYIIGNWGTNNKFHPTKEKPLHIYAGNFDDNASFDMALSKVSKTGELLPVRGKQCSSQQTPILNSKIKTYKEFATSTLLDIYGQENLANATHYEVKNFKSLILKNKGKGEFDIQILPNHAQFGPTLSIITHDFNNDGFTDIFGVGNVYEAEVETIRYDASKGYLLLGNDKREYQYKKDTSYLNHSEAKSIQKIVIQGMTHFIILNKNAELKILKFN